MSEQSLVERLRQPGSLMLDERATREEAAAEIERLERERDALERSDLGGRSALARVVAERDRAEARIAKLERDLDDTTDWSDIQVAEAKRNGRADLQQEMVGTLRAADERADRAEAQLAEARGHIEALSDSYMSEQSERLAKGFYDARAFLRSTEAPSEKVR